MAKCFLCKHPIANDYEIMAYIRKLPEQRKPGSGKLVYARICLHCAETDPQVDHYKVIKKTVVEVVRSHPAAQSVRRSDKQIQSE